MNDIVEVEGLSYAAGKKIILRNVSFSVRRGERVAVVGPNGAGKTTLLRCLGRICDGWRGEIRVFGKPLSRWSRRTLARSLGYIPQSSGGGFPFLVRDFVRMSRYPYLNLFSSGGESDARAVREALDVTGTTAFEDRRIDTLSGGERQRVFIAATIAQGASIWLLDEPMTFLDPRQEAEMAALLDHAHRQRGVTVLSVTHDINSAVLRNDRILALKDGAAAFYGTADELMDEETLRNVFGTSFLFTVHPRTGKRIVVPEVST